MMTSSRTRTFSWKRRSVLLLIIGTLVGQFTYRIIISLFLRGQHTPCAPAVSFQTTGKNSVTQPTNAKELLFVGVMTSRRYLPTRAKAIHSTWGSSLRGSITFFVGGGDKVEDSELPIQVLEDVKDSEYPPQRKSFSMLQSMFDKYGHRYEWFMRADDDLFVDVDRLRTLLSSLNSSKPFYLGHPGTGKPEEEGKLGLPAGTPYCMGGTGVVLSKTLLGSLSGRLEDCLKTTFSAHEDSELGRCVYNVTGLSCLQSQKVFRRFKQNYDDTSGEWIQKVMRPSRPYVTFHPVKDTRYMYHSAAQVGIQRVTQLQGKVRQLLATIACIADKLGTINRKAQNVVCSRRNCTSQTSPSCEFGKERKRVTHFESFRNVSWFLIDQNSFYTFWIYDLKKPVSHAGVSDGVTQVLRHLAAYVKATSRRSKHTTTGTFYRRVISGVGVEYVAFVRDSSSSIRPYLIREAFDDIIVVEKQ